MDYPGRIIKMGEQDAAIVKLLKVRLNQGLVVGLNTEQLLDTKDPNFGADMKQVIKLYQARHVDPLERPLIQDGEVGSITWESLFGTSSVPASHQPGTTFLSQVLTKASGEEARHVREIPPNSNRGPQVEAYLQRVGAQPGLSWCCAFVYWCFDEAAKDIGMTNPMVRTAGCLDHWSRAPSQGAQRIMTAKAVNNPALLQAGMIFIMDYGNGMGHTGLIEKVQGGLITTIEGNTDASKTREGGGVYRLTRKINEVSKGFIDYGNN